MSLALPTTLRVTEREFAFFRLTWKGTVFTSFVTPVLFLVALGVGLGSLMGDRPALDGLDYLDFLSPGLMVAAAAQLGGGMALWPIMAGHRWIGFHRAMASTPVSAKDIPAGFLLWIGLRAVAQGSGFLVVAALLGGVDSAWGAVAPLVAGMTAAAFTAPLMAYTATCDSDRTFDPIMRVVVTPLYLFSGSYFPTSQLPAALEFLAKLFPLWHGIEVARGATTGTLDLLDATGHLAVVVLWISVGLLFARRTFSERLAS